MTIIVGWVAWVIVAFLALLWVHGFRDSARKGERLGNSAAVTTFFFWVVAVVFLFTSYSKMHILWVAPLSFDAALFLTVAGLLILTTIVLWFNG
jgi:hypothetical protein